MKWSLLLFCLLPLSSFGALSKLYPTSATVEIRDNAYIDGISTIYNSTNTEFMRYEVNGSTSEFGLSTGTVEAVKLKLINEILDKDINYTVLPSTECPSDWHEWRFTSLTNKAPASCP